MPAFTNFKIGLSDAIDTGRGRSVTLAWNEAIPTVNALNEIAYLIYYSTKRLDVFSDGIKYIADHTQVTIPNLTNSDTYYFAIKATEFDSADLDLDGLQQIASHLYLYADTALSATIDADDTVIPVNSVDGFPTSGYITISSEAIEYASVQISPFPAFILTDAAGRGAKSALAAAHSSGASVYLYTGYRDNNSVIERATPTIQYPLNYNADGYDGYTPRSKGDIVTTDYSVAEQKVDFMPYDYCGYHSTDPEAYFKGELCGTYVGGEYNGSRGLNLFERNMGRLELMINQTGEPSILLQRKWSGEKCPCIENRRERQRARCGICYGTGFVGGYDVYFFPRTSPEGKIFVRFSPHEEDLIRKAEGLSQETKPNAWTLPFPVIKDSDFIIRFDEAGNELWRYEVLRATRNKLFYVAVGQQGLVLSRKDKTHIIYQFPTSLL